MRTLLVRYGLAVTSIVLIAFLLPLGFMAQSLTEERAIAAGRQDAQQVALFTDDPVRLLEQFRTYRPPSVSKWLD